MKKILVFLFTITFYGTQQIHPACHLVPLPTKAQAVKTKEKPKLNSDQQDEFDSKLIRAIRLPDLLPLWYTGIKNRKPDEASIQKLLQAGANPNIMFKGAPILFYANASVTKILLDAGAAVNAINGNGETALIKAAAQDDVEKAKVLLEAGANINAIDNKKASAINHALYSPYRSSQHLLVAHGANLPLIKLLVAHGADLTRRPHYWPRRNTYEAVTGMYEPHKTDISKAIKEGLEEQELQRITYSKEAVAPQITENINEGNFPKDLSNMIADLAVEEAPATYIPNAQRAASIAAKANAEEKKKEQEAEQQTWCVVS
jgi:hypothetical protein